jgi:Uma2 family endonuclease
MGIAISEDRRAGLMSGPAFREFQDHRPDHERWELIAGVPMMMSPPTIAHNRIAGNLERLLNEALERHAPTRIATSVPVSNWGPAPSSPSPTSA